MKKQPELTAATRQTFVEAFCKIIEIKSLNKVTIKEITTLAGYNRSTFYQYFQDIYGILDYIEDDVIAYMKENLLPILLQNNNNSNLLESFPKLFAEKKRYIQILFGSRNNVSCTRRMKNEMKIALIHTLNLPKDNVCISYILEYHISAMLGVITKWQMNQDEITITQLAALIMDISKQGVLSQLEKYRL